MIQITNENVIFVDVDGTLITKEQNSFPAISFTNYGIEEVRYPILSHINLIKKNKARGLFIVVWSQNGYLWCKEVISKLELTDYVDMVMTKPSIYVDDLPAHEWTFRVFLEKQ